MHTTSYARVHTWLYSLVCLLYLTMVWSTECNGLDSSFNLGNCSCPEDYYGPVFGVTYECIKCPMNLTSMGTSKHITSCGCSEGMYLETGGVKDMYVNALRINDLWGSMKQGQIVGNCTQCPEGSTSTPAGINSCVCASATSVLVEGRCVDVCHLTHGGCACHLSVHGELVDCDADGSDVGTALYTSGRIDASNVFSILEFGAVHACAVRYPSGSVVCWNIVPPLPGGLRPQIEAPLFITDARALSVGVEHSCALWGVENTLNCWGVPGVIGQASEVQVSHRVRMLAVGHPTSRHVCFLYVSKMFVSCIGLNTHGQLGLGVGGDHIYQLLAEDIVSYT